MAAQTVIDVCALAWFGVVALKSLTLVFPLINVYPPGWVLVVAIVVRLLLEFFVRGLWKSMLKRWEAAIGQG